MKQLINSDLCFRRLNASSYSGMTFFDEDYHIKYRSPTSERLTGWPTTDRLNVPVSDMVHPEDREGVILLLQEVRQTPGLSLTATFRSKHYAGHNIWLQATYTNMLNEPGVEAIVCSFIDISAQKKTEEDFHKQTTQINELLETMSDSFITLDENLCYTYANPQVLKLVDKRAEDLLGKYIWDVFPDAIGSATWQAIDTAFREKIYVCNEDFYPPLQLWQENRVYPSGGGISMFIRDITERKKSELLLSESEKQYSELFQFSPLPKFVFDINNLRFLDVNKAALTHYGYTREEFLQLSVMDISPPEDIPAMIKILDAHRNKKTFSLQQSVSHRKKNGEIIQVDIQSNSIFYKGHDARLVIARDITQSLSHVKAIQEQNEKLKEISWMQSHIIRGPLARIMALVPLIEDTTGLSEETRQILQYLSISAKELDDVIHDIIEKANREKSVNIE